MPRIAVGGIHTECSTYSPLLMQMEDFRVLRGSGLLSHDHFAFLRQFDAEFVPLLHARAVPGGPVSAQVYQALKAEFLDLLRAVLPVDGVLLAMHGAVKVDGMFDAEADWIGAVRSLVGPDIPVAASYDLHGNVSDGVVDALDIFAAYRTAPHVDTQETMAASAAMLLRALESGERPGIVYVPVPLLLPGERSSTEDEPARRLYRALPALEGPTVWRTDLMIGYVWADEPRATAAAIVTGTDRVAASAAAEGIASEFWAARDEFAFGPVTGPLDEMLDIAERTSTRPVILADSGDNPTGGGVGDRADVLAALIARDWSEAIVAGIADRPATEACFAAGAGAQLDLRIGASLDPAGVRVQLRAEVVTLDHGESPADRQAVVRSGGLIVVLAARRRPYHDIADFTRLGLDPSGTRLLVVKSGYLSPELAPLANPNLMALTDGAVNQDIRRLENCHRPAGTLPFDKRDSFTATARPSRRFAGRKPGA
ncbi:M81 family metallopeptidase [Paracoccus aurantiacus]|uniref:Microcystinase C n=1 Tax=Paracoccus aurantiacus TaxID=2599412 RepID=A0A5C6S4V8_9RHOB|nr:M81 family metallopeptidase [Paracoccus aurantiacus]TXB69287.1 M81 family metallopeptidase [Paracoccus aurantiacus]